MGVECGRAGGTSATCANTRWPYQCSTLASFLALFHLQRKERLPFISFLLLLLMPVPSTFVLIVVTYIYVNIIMNNRSINSLMRQYVPIPPSLALVLSMLRHCTARPSPDLTFCKNVKRNLKCISKTEGGEGVAE